MAYYLKDRKKTIIIQLHTQYPTEDKIEMFWDSRKLRKLISADLTKQLKTTSPGRRKRPTWKFRDTEINEE